MSSSVSSTNVRSGSQAVVIAGSARGTWAVINADAKQQQTLANILALNLNSDAYVKWIEVPPGVTRILLRVKMPVATISNVGTAPLISVIGAWRTTDAATITASSTPVDGSIEYMRLDAATAAAAGTSLVPTGTVTTSKYFNDATYYYSDPIDLTGYDLKGCDYVTVCVPTIAATTGAGAMPIEALFLN